MHSSVKESHHLCVCGGGLTPPPPLSLQTCVSSAIRYVYVCAGLSFYMCLAYYWVVVLRHLLILVNRLVHLLAYLTCVCVCGCVFLLFSYLRYIDSFRVAALICCAESSIQTEMHTLVRYLRLCEVLYC